MTPIPYDALGEEGLAVAKDAVGQSRGPIELGCPGCQVDACRKVEPPPTAPTRNARTTLDPSGRPDFRKEKGVLLLIVTF